ncbi:MAG: hypothetical protein ACR2LM_08310 [Pyrinomonadaceae bacterium]
MDTTPLKLYRILIGKSIAETLFVAVLAVGFFFTAFPPYFHGFGEATPGSISGWAVNSRAPFDRVEVQLFIDGSFAASGVANKSRPDVSQAGWSPDEWHGYSFPITQLSVGVHEASVYAVHESGGGIRRTLQLLGYPIRFSVDENGRLTDLVDRSKK